MEVSMPQSILIAIFVLGAVLILIAIVGGKFKIFGAEVSGNVGRAGRAVSAVIGTVLIIFGLFKSFNSSGVPDNNQNPDSGNLEILSFQVEPPLIGEHESAQLKWVVRDASSIIIDNGIGSVPSEGSRLVNPNQSTIYTLTASRGTQMVKATTKVNIKSLSWEDKNSVGTMPGDGISHFRVLNYSPKEMMTEISYNYNPQHGQVYIGAYLLDENERNISRGYWPAGANPTGKSQVKVSTDPSLGRIKSKWVFFWLCETNKGQGFVSKRFPYEQYWN
jgi:hypothetical protein